MFNHPSLFLFLLTFLTYSSFAQSPADVSVGPMIKQTFKTSWADIEPIGSDDQGIYYIMSPYSAVLSGPVAASSDFYIGKVDRNAELQFKATSFPVDGKSSTYEFTNELNGKTYVFSSVEDKKARNVTFYRHELDKSSLTLTQPQPVTQLSFADLKKEYETARFKSQLSPDKSKMLISYSLVNKENNILTFGYQVIDSNFKKVSEWTGNLTISDGCIPV